MNYNGIFLRVAAAILIAVGMVFGAPVSFETAQNVARKHLEQNRGGKIKQTPSPKTRAFVPYFVFEKENGGFIIISADDVAVPILGETDKGTFDKENMPPALLWLLSTYEEQIKEAVNIGETQDSATKVLWEQTVQGSNLRGLRAVTYPEQLISTKWDQGSPYNLLTPLDGGKNSLTCCVATAMAQIIKYWQYPIAGTGTSVEYKTATKNLSVPAVNFNVNYDYANMLDTYTPSGGTTAQRSAVSTLMYHCGVSMKTDYQASSSSALQDITSAMKSNFGYDNCIKYVWTKNSPTITASDWKDLIIGQIENNTPVFYTGVDEKSGGGHAFIVDGYKSSTGQFHLNWGWSGNSNGFFAIDAVQFPSAQTSYSKDQGMVMNIMPNKNGNPPSQIKVSSFAISSTPAAISANIRAKMNYGVDFDGLIGFAVVSNGSVIKVLDSASYKITNTYSTGGRYTVNYKDASLNRKIDADIPSGLLTLQVVTKRGGGVWTPVGETDTVTITAPAPVLYYITFNANGGTIAQESATTGTDGKLNSLPTPSRNGYTFNGWFTSSATTGGSQITTSTVFNTDSTVYARWTLITYTVTFNLNGGSGTAPARIIVDIDAAPDSTLNTSKKPSVVYTRNGYVNDGNWYTRSGTSPNYIYKEFVFGDNGTKVGANITLYLQWKPAYNVVFDVDGDTITIKTGFNGTLDSFPSKPEKENHTFDGWFTTVTGGEEEVEVTERTVFNAHATVSAKFKAATPIREIKKSDGRVGIRLYNNVVSDKAEFELVLPNNESVSQVKFVVYDNVGNVVFETTRKGVISWNLTNGAHRNVANGSYLIVAEAKGRGGNVYMYSVKVGVRR